MIKNFDRVPYGMVTIMLNDHRQISFLLL